jgi:hypothetical protein
MPANASVRVSFDMDEIHELSLDLIHFLEEDDIEVGEAALAFALSLGRVLSPSAMDQDEQIAFTKSCLEWAQCYFVQGVPN